MLVLVRLLVAVQMIDWKDMTYNVLMETLNPTRSLTNSNTVWRHWSQDHSHCTMYNNYSSDLRTVSAGIIQGSGVGPSLYVVEVSDLNTVTPGNLLCKYADDTYIIIPASRPNSHTRLAEIEHIESWSKDNNLTLNRS